MKTITIITPNNIEVEFRLAGAASRLAAFVIDFIIQLAVIIFIFWAAFRITGDPGSIALSIIMIVSFAIHFGYFILAELLMNGQSIGKRLLSLRVIRDNGQPVEFAQVLVRGIIRTTIDMLYAGLFMILFSPKHKRLGDIAAGTIVVIEKNTGSAELPGPMPEWPDTFPGPLTLSTEERHLAEEFLRRKDTLPSEKGTSIEAKLINFFSASNRASSD